LSFVCKIEAIFSWQSQKQKILLDSSLAGFGHSKVQP